MDRYKQGDLPHEDQQGIDEEAKMNRKEIDDIPPQGTDPLHEGP
jgi:hypothetical protein